MASFRIRGMRTAARRMRSEISYQPTAPSFSQSRRSSTSTAPSNTTPIPRKHYYVTTPIFYVNADPHIGHLHSTLLADVYARYSHLRNPNSPKPILCTGTDEHGLKIQRVAEQKGIEPNVLCDNVSERFKDLASKANIDYDIFIRTTEERHREAVQHVWRKLNEKGLIYKSTYSGWYAVSDEAYYPEAQVSEIVDPSTGVKNMVSTETGTKVEWMEEENYKFRLSSFAPALIKWLSASPNVMQPPSRTTSLLASLQAPASADLLDLSISRPASRLTWGIQVPHDPEHTIYVWIDALVNYLTAAGYPWKGGEAFKEGEVWPPELMIVGKDIIRFHALYLPAVLMALHLPLPKNILAHGHWTMDKFKMSKSRGNVADPFEAMERWGTDAMRAYLIRVGGNSASDAGVPNSPERIWASVSDPVFFSADYSADEIARFYRKDLAGTIGNLFSRVAQPKLLSKLPSPEQLYTLPDTIEPADEELHKLLLEIPDLFESHMSTFALHHAFSSLLAVVQAANRHLQTLSPWLASASPSDLRRALFYSSESLRIAGILLQPFMPSKSVQLLDSLGVHPDRRGWKDARLGEGTTRKMGDPKKYLFEAVKTTTEEELRSKD